MVRWVVGCAGVLYGLSVVATLCGGLPGVQSPEPQSAASTKIAPGEPLRGFTINLHYTEQFPRYLQAVDQLADIGFNSLQVLTPVFQTDGSSDQVRIETGPGRGPTRTQLVDLLTHARRRGLRTALMPVVLFTTPRDNEWRGKIHPEYWDPWWRSYRRAVDYFVDVAVQTGVSVFCVGSELISTERQPQRWVSLIKDVRAKYHGLLTYSTTWDHYHVPTIWEHVDLIGISAYWDVALLTEYEDPDPGLLGKRWRQIRAKILAFAAAQRKPVLFTEVGYPSLPWALKEPWNYVNPGQAAPDPSKQTLGYASFLSAWGDLLNGIDRGAPDAPPPHELAGVFFYEWDPYHSGGPGDTGYGVRGKPTEELLRRWLASVR